MPADDAAFKEIVAERVLTVLRRLVKRGAVVKSGTSGNAQWVLAPSLLSQDVAQRSDQFMISNSCP
jgi:hypothetical protein